MLRLFLFASVFYGIYFLWDKTQMPGTTPLSKNELRETFREEVKTPSAPNAHAPRDPSLTQVFERAVEKLQRENSPFDPDALANLPPKVSLHLQESPEEAPRILTEAIEETAPTNRFDRRLIVEFAKQLDIQEKAALSSIALRVLEVPTSEHLTEPGEEELFRAACDLMVMTTPDLQKRSALLSQLLERHPSTAAQEILNSLSSASATDTDASNQ